MERASFGAGCFWGVEAAFRKVKGVFDTAAGYMGGTYEHPSHEDVCEDRTGHTEVVQVRFDPRQVSYEDLLAVFWSIHDPSLLDQEAHHGVSQHRSVVFAHTPEQMRAALASRSRLAGSRLYSRPILTEIAPAGAFWKAEESHQRRLEKLAYAQQAQHAPSGSLVGALRDTIQTLEPAWSLRNRPAWLFM